MTRDMELIRKIIGEIQSWPDARERNLHVDGYDSNVVGRHVEMLCKAGFIEGFVHGGSMQHELTSFVKDLTWEGHDFAAAIQNDTVWAKMKQTIDPAELATLPLSIVKKVGFSLLETYVMNKAGLSS